MKNEVFLVTTALKEFFGNSNKRIALGEWCKVDENEIFIETLPYIWDTADKTNDAATYSWQIYDLVLKDLVEKLNSYHNVNQDKRYWEIIIGNWLYTFIQSVYDRYCSIKQAIDLIEDFNTIVLSKKSFITPVEYGDFINKVCSDEYNLQLYSQIFSFFGFKFQELEFNTKQKLKYSHKRSFEKNIFFKAINLFSYKPKITITSPYFDGGLKSYLKVFFKSKGKLIYDDFDDSFDFEFEINKSARKKLFDDYINEDRFVSLLYKLFEVNFPILFFEGYKPFSSFVNGIKKNNSKLFATANALHNNYTYKFYLAAKYKKTNIISIQHGGGYGVEKISSPEIYERNIVDCFFNFGWHSDDKTIISTHEKLNKEIISNKNGDIIYVSTQLPRYIYRLQTKYNSSLMRNIYLKKNISFFEHIKNIDKFLYRPYMNDYGFKITENILKNIKELKIETKRLALEKRLNNSKLIVLDHFDTIILEVLAQNYPTIVYIEKDIHSFRKPEIISLLEDAKILFYDEVAAAKHINNINEDIDSWWLSPKVQKAREKFCYYYARTSDDWAEDWMKEFNNILEENARNNS